MSSDGNFGLKRLRFKCFYKKEIRLVVVSLESSFNDFKQRLCSGKF